MTVACGLMPVLQPGEHDAEFELSDYEGARARWCPGCGDHSILTAVQRLLTAEQLTPEQTVFVSGIGCSSRFRTTSRPTASTGSMVGRCRWPPASSSPGRISRSSS